MTDEFKQMLDARAEADAGEWPARDEAIWNRYGRECAVFISDMSSFSRITRDRGIVHFLTLIRRMERICAETIAEHGGQVVKTIADNLFATFPSAQNAVDAAIALRDRFERDGRTRDESDRVKLAIGIDAGKILDVDGEDMFGEPVNVASKLGEDLAHGGDILVTASAAKDLVVPSTFRTETRKTTISKIEVDYVAIVSAE